MRPASEVYQPQDNVDIYDDMPDLAASDHESDDEDSDNDSEDFEQNGSDSDYIETEDGPGIARS